LTFKTLWLRVDSNVTFNAKICEPNSLFKKTTMVFKQPIDATSELENLYRSSPNGLCLLDPELRFIRLNQRMATINGKDIEDHLGLTISEVNPEIARQLISICKKAISTRQSVLKVEIDCTETISSGKRCHYRVSCSPIMFDQYKVTGVNLVIQDITESREAQYQIGERLSFETLLSELSAKFVNLPPESVDQEIINGLERVATFLGVDRSDFSEVTDSKEFRLVFSFASPSISNSDSALTQEYRVADTSLPWYAGKLHRGDIVKMATPEELPAEAYREKEMCQRTGMKSSLTIPLSVGGSIRYTISMDLFKSHRNWPNDLVSRIRLVGNIFSNALTRKWADNSLHRAFSEIKDLKLQLEAEWNYLQEEIKLEHNFEEIIGNSDELRYVLFKVEQIANADTTVLVLGETGTGKELVARALHHLSPRKNRPMVKVNCAALPTNLIESELFGHEKGAFSGAIARKIGRFELANGSTLFLDELGELPLELQPKLLRVLQEGEFERLGSSHTQRTDVRIIAATNRNLEDEVKEKRFREDLWYRLNIFPITLPPLRQRSEDISLLVNHFVHKISKKMGKKITKVPQQALVALKNYAWPGNVRELENVVERAVINSMGSSLSLADNLSKNQKSDYLAFQKKTLDEMNQDYISMVLDETGGKVYGSGGAAEILGLNPETLRSRIRKLGIRTKVFRK
jgi:formate hydrogenlyase transcriptional activator